MGLHKVVTYHFISGNILLPRHKVCVTASYGSCNCVLLLMKMVSKQSSPFMELLVQLCLTVCATASYGLWKWLQVALPFMETVLEVVRAEISGYIKS